MTRPLNEVMRQLENYTLSWHHWLIVLYLLKVGGSGTAGQILSILKKEGFSSHSIMQVLKRDLVELGEAIDVEGDIENPQDATVVTLTSDPRFQSFLKKHLKSVVASLKTRSSR
ncbi:MAG: hypothetical protein HXY34_09210 [Candidatus Thorarchaeota archaeon]|nr:hypothetical protein [Candidatus Thorarchaeota archaeon]